MAAHLRNATSRMDQRYTWLQNRDQRLACRKRPFHKDICECLTPTGNTINIHVKPSDTDNNVRKRAGKVEGNSSYHQYLLMFASELLKDDHTLSEYYIVSRCDTGLSFAWEIAPDSFCAKGTLYVNCVPYIA